MEFVKGLILFSCLLVLANGAHFYLEHTKTQELRTKRDTASEFATGAFDSKVLDSAESKQIPEENFKEDSKQVDKADGEEVKSLGIIKNPFQIMSSVFGNKPNNGVNNQQVLNKPGSNYGSGNPQNAFQQNPWFNGHDQFTNPPFLVPNDHYNGNDKPFIFHLTDSNNFYNGPRPFPPKKPSFGLSQHVGNYPRPNYGARFLTKKKFLSLFKPVTALASIFKKPIIIKPVTNEVVAIKPHENNVANNKPQVDQKPGKPIPSTQGQKPFSKPNGNLAIRPVFLRPHYGNWGTPSYHGFGMDIKPNGPFRRPHWSHGYHDFPMNYQGKTTDGDVEIEAAPFYMIDDIDESQRQEYPVLIPAELIDEIDFADEEDDVTFESRTIDEQTNMSDKNEAKTSAEKKEVSEIV